METKVCIECGIEKELLTNFGVEGKGGQFRRNKCKACVRKWNSLPKEERERIKQEQKEAIRTKIEKVCPTCNLLKPRDAFYKKVYNLDGMSAECRVCDDHRGHQRRINLREKQITNPSTVTQLECRGCGENKPISQFTKNVATTNGFDNQCKKCKSIDWSKRSRDPTNRRKWLLNRIQTKCNQLNLEFDLTLDDLIIPEICPVLGIPLKFGTPNKGYTHHADEGSPSVDRIDPDKGYTKDNIVIVSWRANRLKGNATIEELRLVADFYSQFSKEKLSS